jgi:hypothetical protein
MPGMVALAGGENPHDGLAVDAAHFGARARTHLATDRPQNVNREANWNCRGVFRSEVISPKFCP